MPRYDYRCSKGHIFEFERPFGSSIKPKSCPECGTKKLERLLVPPSVQFKGSGWYKTDSRPAVKEMKESTQPKPEAKPAVPEPPQPEPSKPEKKTTKKDAA